MVFRGSKALVDCMLLLVSGVDVVGSLSLGVGYESYVTNIFRQSCENYE